MKRIGMFCVVMLSLGGLLAQHVSQQEAMNAASRFLESQHKNLKRCAAVMADGSDTLLYIFNADNAFVVVSGDKRVPPVLAFSDHQLYNTEDVIPPVKMWLDNYQQQLLQLKQQPVAQDVHSGWRNLAEEKATFKGSSEVLPMMKSHWGQGTFYSYYCPRDYAGENNHVATGCVATAMAQLIYYYRFPNTGIGSYSYLDSTYGVQSADYGNTTYDYSAMCDDPTSVNTAISTLIYHCGVGVDMVYGPDGSGMYNHSAAKVLRTYFKFSPQTQYVFRDSTDMDWDSLIVSHLERNMPLYYAGWSNPNINGHGFICDGYKMVDSNYYYHFNFGWDGSADGYFYTNALNLSGTHFNLAQELIVNAYPDTTLYEYPPVHALTGTDTLTAMAGSFTDGSLAHCPYANNMDYTWVIRPKEDYFSSISFKIEYNIAEGDTLWVSCDNSAVAPLLFTGSDSLLNVDWNCTEITVRFVTDDTLAMNGFRASYNTVFSTFCQGISTRSSPSGTIQDGSGTQDYRPFSLCKYRIVVPMYDVIQLHFEYLDLEEGKDFLRVYDNNFSEDNLLMSLTGTMTDTTLSFYHGILALLFETDDQNNADGFKLTYQAGHVGVEDYETSSLIIFPNPVSDRLFVHADNEIRSVEVVDMLGRAVHLTAERDDNGVSLSVSDLPSGIYLLRLNINNQTITRKFIKQ